MACQALARRRRQMFAMKTFRTASTIVAMFVWRLVRPHSLATSSPHDGDSGSIYEEVVVEGEEVPGGVEGVGGGGGAAASSGGLADMFAGATARLNLAWMSLLEVVLPSMCQ